MSSAPPSLARRLVGLLLLPALLGLSIDVELAHEHGLVAPEETQTRGAHCVQSHDGRDHDPGSGWAPAAEPHRHDCAACHLAQKGRATLARATSVGPALLAVALPTAGSLHADGPADGLPSSRGPPAV